MQLYRYVRMYVCMARSRGVAAVLAARIANVVTVVEI